MAELKLTFDDGGSIQGKIDKIHEVILGIERVKQLIKEISEEEISITINGDTYVDGGE